MKNLRDTYASQLVTCPAQLGYMSRQLGHVRPAVTASTPHSSVDETSTGTR